MRFLAALHKDLLLDHVFCRRNVAVLQQVHGRHPEASSAAPIMIESS